jgi:hypothetical protein
MKQIPLTKGKFALVDDEDFDWLNQWKWHLWSNKRKENFPRYACRSSSNRKVFMHRVIVDATDGMEPNHIDGNGLNNQRGNLLIGTHMQNMQGFRLKRKNVTSLYRGVWWDKCDQKWYCQIIVDKKRKYLGRFDEETEAACKYNEAALEYFGRFAHLNTINVDRIYA